MDNFRIGIEFKRVAMKSNRESNEELKPVGEGRTVRERTLAHMKTLLRNTTKLGAGIALACGVATQGCGIRHVVDPPPPPPPGTCGNPNTLPIDYCVPASAHWQKSGRKWTIILNLGVETGINNIDFEGLTRADVRVSGATARDITIGLQTLEAVLFPINGRSEAEVQLSLRCNLQPLPFRVKLDLSKPHKKNGNVPVELIK
jgi:hypothetical protein